LTKIYSNSKTRALDEVSFSLPSSGIFVLIGRNGSGKTTLVRILATELEPTSGSVRVNGIDAIKQANRMTPMQTIVAYLLWRGFRYGEAKRRALEALEKVGLGEQANSINRSLSAGMRRKVMVATVLSSEAEVIFLDEPTTGLDPISRREFQETLREIGKERFTFLTTHYLEEAELLADQIGILDRGRLVRIGTLEDLRKSVDYNYSMRLFSSPASLPALEKGELVTGSDGSVRILTVEEEAFRISRELSRSGFKFAINPLSLDDIFFYLASQGGAK
jgi:ABC-2 type transport system ATP-binding protein